jgi:hypothetical protein
MRWKPARPGCEETTDVDYAAEIAAARRKRDKRVERASAEAREAMARAAVERDAEVRRLKAEGLVGVQIASRVGCSRSLVYELLNADRKAQYDARRREHWRHLRVA